MTLRKSRSNATKVNISKNDKEKSRKQKRDGQTEGRRHTPTDRQTGRLTASDLLLKKNHLGNNF